MTERNEQKQKAPQKSVEADSEAKFRRHRVDDYVAIIIGVGSCLVLWLLQLLGFY